jgi:hypothetical protein
MGYVAFGTESSGTNYSNDVNMFYTFALGVNFFIFQCCNPVPSSYNIINAAGQLNKSDDEDTL